MINSNSVLGLLSDSHGHASTTAAAVAALLEAGATMLVHLGDIGSEAVIDELVGHRARIVFGNCDHNDSELRRYAELVDVRVDHPWGELTVDGKRIAFSHGHLPEAMSAAWSRKPDYLLHGHTHELRDERIDGTRVINPGALFRASRYTAAVLDPTHDRLVVVEIAKGSREPPWG